MVASVAAVCVSIQEPNVAAIKEYYRNVFPASQGLVSYSVHFVIIKYFFISYSLLFSFSPGHPLRITAGLSGEYSKAV